MIDKPELPRQGYAIAMVADTSTVEGKGQPSAKVAHDEAWVDEPIPARDGLTPSEAVQTRQGRQKVMDLVDEIEAQGAREVPSARYDVSRLRAMLGLDVGRR